MNLKMRLRIVEKRREQARTQQESALSTKIEFILRMPSYFEIIIKLSAHE